MAMLISNEVALGEEVVAADALDNVMGKK